MDINRHNYESFFLLYVDNELTTAERKDVDDFVRQHPDLLPELEMLQQAVLPVQTFAFADRASLLKQTLSAIQQEQLLLLLDDELPAGEAANVRQTIAANAALRAEWTILQQTRCDAGETVVFEDKASLYRKVPVRVIGARWWKVAAAAVLLGFGVYTFVQFSGTDTPGTAGTGTIVNNNPAPENNIATPENTMTQAPVKQLTTAPVAAATINNQPAVNNAPAVNATAAKQSATSPEPAMQKSNIARQSNNFNADVLNDLDRSQNFNKEKSNETTTAAVLIKDNNLQPAIKESVTVKPFKDDVADNQAKKIILQDVAMNNVISQDAATTEEQYLNPAERKSKRSGLLRKVSRLFQRKSEDRPQGNGLKIAGFEIAVR